MSDEPLTLERLAQLDAAASPGPYCSVHFEGTSWVCATDPPLTGDQDADTAEFDVSVRIASCDEEPERAFNAVFLAACKDAPTRLLAALRDFDKRERADAKPHTLASEHADEYLAFQSGAERVLDRLRHLIETYDLAAPEQPQ